MLGRLACGTLAALVLAVPAGAAVPPGNLLTNPGAEAGPGAPDGATILAPPGWVVAGEFTAVQYGAPNFLTAQDGAALNGGANFFAGGNQPQSEGSQTVDVSAAAAEIDAGSVSATLSGLLGGFSGQDDSATISATLQTA